jgi:hypothetical protein
MLIFDDSNDGAIWEYMDALYNGDFESSNNYYIGTTYNQTYFTCDVDFDTLTFENLCYFV